jgi:hypothetical protein
MQAVVLCFEPKQSGRSKEAKDLEPQHIVLVHGSHRITSHGLAKQVKVQGQLSVYSDEKADTS